MSVSPTVSLLVSFSIDVRVRACVRVCACVRARVCVCVRAHARERAYPAFSLCLGLFVSMSVSSPPPPHTPPSLSIRRRDGVGKTTYSEC